MGIYMRDNGFYYVKVEQGGQTYRFSTKTKDRELAEELYRTFLQALMSKKITGLLTKDKSGVSFVTQGAPDSPEPIEKHFQKWLETDQAKGVTKNTVLFKKRLLRTILSNGIKTFDDFNQDRINQLLVYLRENYPANDTILKYVSKLKAFMHYSVKHGLLDQTVVNRLDFPRLPTRARTVVLTESEFHRIILHLEAKNDIDFAVYLKTLYFTCSRPAEVMILKVSDIDFKQNMIQIYQSKVAASGQAIKYAYIPSDFSEALKIYLEKTGKLQNPDSFIFSGANSSNANFYGCKFKKLKRNLGLPDAYNLYTIRHTAITDTLTVTGDIEFASSQAGHSNIDMTRHYTHRNHKQYSSLAEKMKKPPE